MKDEIIKFETAKLAKENGYLKINGWMGFVDKFYHPRTKTLLSMGRTGKTPFNDLIYAPTQSLLQRWLREKHDIFVTVSIPYSEFGKYSSEVWENNLEDGVKILAIDGMTVFTSYEESLEEGLLEALKLIK